MKRTTGALGTLLVATLSVAMPSGDSHGDTDRIARERPAAIRALYGGGLSVEIKGDKISLDWGTMTETTWQRYVTDHYLPALEGWGFPLPIDSQVVFGQTYDHKGKLAAHILIEPVEKLMLCEQLAQSIRDDDLENQMRDFCREQALRHISSPIVAFRGKPVSHEAPSRFVGAGLGEPLFEKRDGKRDVLITVAGPGELDTHRGYRAVGWIANNIRFDAPQALRQLAADAKRDAARGLKAAKARIAKRDKPFAKARGNVVFGKGYVEGWDPIKPIAKRAVPTCRNSFAHIYGPKKQGSYELTLRANGVHCGGEIESQGFIIHASLYGTCKKHLVPGKNTITVVVAKNVNKVAGKRWDKRKLKKVKYYSNKAGKVMAEGQLTCTR